MTRSIIALLAAVVMMSEVAVATGASPQQAARGNRARAVTAADQLLGDVVLPADATQLPSAPAVTHGVLAHPSQAFWVASQVDRHRFWRTAASPAAVMRSIRAHLPGDAALSNHGYSGSERFATYAFPNADRAALVAQQLVVAALRASDGSTVIRADGEVKYLAPRPYGERIPASARVLDITVGSNLSPPLLHLTVTAVPEVHRIARFVDQLPFAGNESGVAFSCPFFPPSSPVDSFVFRRARGDAPLAQVTELAATPTEDFPCFVASLTVHGRREPALQDGGILLRQAGRLLKVRLTR